MYAYAKSLSPNGSRATHMPEIHTAATKADMLQLINI
jgi:hypothetical protein